MPRLALLEHCESAPSHQPFPVQLPLCLGNFLQLSKMTPGSKCQNQAQTTNNKRQTNLSTALLVLHLRSHLLLLVFCLSETSTCLSQDISGTFLVLRVSTSSVPIRFTILKLLALRRSTSAACLGALLGCCFLRLSHVYLSPRRQMRDQMTSLRTLLNNINKLTK